MNTHANSCVARVPIFRGLSPEEQGEVARFAHTVRAGRGDVLYSTGTRRGRLLVLHNGRVNLVHLSPDGRERVVRLLGPGDVVGEAAFLTGNPTDHAALVASDAEMCEFRHADLAGLVARHPQIAIRMLHDVTARLQEAERRLAKLSLVGASERLAAYLLDLPAQRSAAGRISVELPIAKNEIASYLGTTAETLSRRLADLQRSKVVELRGREVILLDLPELERLASS